MGLVLFVVMFCKPKEKLPFVCSEPAVQHPQSEVSLKLVFFQKRVLWQDQQGELDALTSLKEANALGWIPYSFDASKESPVQYIERCLVLDYEKCRIGQGIFQPTYDYLFKGSDIKEDDLIFDNLIFVKKED
jgi:hypothetical protein